MAHHEVGTLFGVRETPISSWSMLLYRGHNVVFVARRTKATPCSWPNGFAQCHATDGVATVTHGPGLGNTVNALAEAAAKPNADGRGRRRYADGHPRHTQSLDQRNLVLSTGAASNRSRRPRRPRTALPWPISGPRVEQRPIVISNSDRIFNGSMFNAEARSRRAEHQGVPAVER